MRISLKIVDLILPFGFSRTWVVIEVGMAYGCVCSFMIKISTRSSLTGAILKAMNSPVNSLSPVILEHELQQLTEALQCCHPKAILLFGSAVAYLEGRYRYPETSVSDDSPHKPNDLDLMLVCNNPPIGVDLERFSPPLELLRVRVDEVTQIARILRYDTKPVALAKLYASNVARQHARNVILAAMLLGPQYNAFGIEQIEIQGLPDKRDYSRHRILYGHHWWQRLCAWSRERRGPFKRFSDHWVKADVFE